MGQKLALDVLPLTSPHLPHGSPSLLFLHTKIRCLPHPITLGSAHCSCYRPLMARLCLTGHICQLKSAQDSQGHQIPRIICINPGAKKSCPHASSLPANMLSWLVLPSVPHAQTASLHRAAWLQHSSHHLCHPLCNRV